MRDDLDFLDHLERELGEQRAIAARVLDRADALAALREHALAVAHDLRRPITLDDVLASARDEEQHARLRALASRVTGGDPALATKETVGHRSGSAEGF